MNEIQEFLYKQHTVFHLASREEGQSLISWLLHSRHNKQISKNTVSASDEKKIKQTWLQGVLGGEGVVFPVGCQRAEDVALQLVCGWWETPSQEKVWGHEMSLQPTRMCMCMVLTAVSSLHHVGSFFHQTLAPVGCHSNLGRPFYFAHPVTHQPTLSTHLILATSHGNIT